MKNQKKLNSSCGRWMNRKRAIRHGGEYGAEVLPAICYTVTAA
ncbi:hypothetical protein T08_9267 [Trichinella sp. T8]|nr:hypothetical protein T08_9267 [Trichinella sp. T8]